MSADLFPQALYGAAATEIKRLNDEIDRLKAAGAATAERGPEEERWNNAIDWLLNSRHTADPDIQGPFWAHVDGEISLDDLRKS